MLTIKIKDVIEELRFLSDRISTQVRTIAIGLIGITWGLLIGKSGFVGHLKIKLLWVGSFALLAMFLDFLQYFCGYICTDNVRKGMEKEKKEEGIYDYRSWLYRLRSWFFWLKQIILIIVVVCFFVIVLPYLF